MLVAFIYNCVIIREKIVEIYIKANTECIVLREFWIMRHQVKNKATL